MLQCFEIKEAVSVVQLCSKKKKKNTEVQCIYKVIHIGIPIKCRVFFVFFVFCFLEKSPTFFMEKVIHCL